MLLARVAFLWLLMIHVILINITLCTREDVVLIGEFMLLSSVTAL